MEFLSIFSKLLATSVILITIGKFIKSKFIKWIGIILCILTIITPGISFTLGVIDVFK